MKIKTVSATYERKLNTGNYSSATLGITMWADLDEGEDGREVARSLQHQARELVKEEYGRLKAVAQPAGADD